MVYINFNIYKNILFIIFILKNKNNILKFKIKKIKAI